MLIFPNCCSQCASPTAQREVQCTDIRCTPVATEALGVGLLVEFGKLVRMGKLLMSQLASYQPSTRFANLPPILR